MRPAGARCEPTITLEAKAWLVSLACRKAKDLGYPHELWTTRLLARHAREHGPAQGHACLANLAQGTVCKILDQEEVKPHRVRYYLEQRDPDFAEKMAEVLCVYRQVKILKAAAVSKKKSSKAVAIISYDEKPGIQAIATTAPDLPPEPGMHATFAREFEYERHGTVSLLAGIDLVSGKVHALVRDHHRSREFIEFLEHLDAAYPADTAIKLILDNPRTSAFIGITGAQGVGKSTFCVKLKNALVSQTSAPVTLIEGLGDHIRALGFQVGSQADSQSVAAIFSAHLLRERTAPVGIVILDRCAIDALAYVRSLEVNTSIEKKLYEEIARGMGNRLTLAVHLQMSATFAQGHAAHKTLLLRDRVSQAVPEIIREFEVPSIGVDAAAPDSVDKVAVVVLGATHWL